MSLSRQVPLKPFTDEAAILQEQRTPKTKWAYFPITLVDRFTPLGFIALFVLLLAYL